jgi:alkanesulfonate monooxygenase SsuD/methylene tetrahydromethanopterin reductase-like flavin-dependent oxidoreductase (luciferase family)
MRYAINVPNIGELDRLVALGVAADEAGWDGFFVWDQMRLMTDVPVTVFDPWIVLAAVASRTQRIRLGTMITPLARRRPWKLARETVSLDHLSRGRLILGVGLGYPPDADFELLGEDPDARVRAERLDEGLEILVRLWSEERFDFEGRHYHLRDAEFHPGPLQRPRPPIWVGGAWPNRGPFRRAARFDGVVPMTFGPNGTPAEVPPPMLAEIVAYVRKHRAIEEPFDVVAGGVGLDPEEVAAFEAAGTSWYVPTTPVQGPGWEDAAEQMIRGGPGA